jgi:hypothetical protein
LHGECGPARKAARSRHLRISSAAAAAWRRHFQTAAFLLHKRLCGPLANSRFHHRPSPQHQPASKLEAAYHRADTAIQQIVDLLAA